MYKHITYPNNVDDEGVGEVTQHMANKPDLMMSYAVPFHVPNSKGKPNPLAMLIESCPEFKTYKKNLNENFVNVSYSGEIEDDPGCKKCPILLGRVYDDYYYFVNPSLLTRIRNPTNLHTMKLRSAVPRNKTAEYNILLDTVKTLTAKNAKLQDELTYHKDVLRFMILGLKLPSK